MGLAKQYKDFLEQKFGNDVAIFDYVTTFDEFWCSGDHFTPAPHIANEGESSKCKALIILWDGMPDDGTQISKLLVPHLTPLDWVLAFTMKKLALGEKASVNFSIHIIDFTVKAYENAHASRIHGTLLDEMPWLNLYAPLVPSNAPYRKRYAPLGHLMGHDAVQQLVTAVKMADSLGGRERETLERLKNVANLWRSSLMQGNDHHDLNNIVAPILMPIIMELEEIAAGNDESAKDESAKVAFVHRLSWCGLLDLETEKFKAPEFFSSLDIVAIDDQLKMGWDRVLGALVGISPDKVKVMPGSDQIEGLGSSDTINLYGATNPNCLLHALGITQVDADTVNVATDLYKRRKFDSPVSTDGMPRPWMLVLDLRLFSGKLSDERKWYRTLAKAALQIAMKCGKDELAWPGFDEIEQVEHLANEGALDDAHIDTALSLFARLCALRWPSVPVIVFSATGRRTLISKLAEYGNIFLSSPKPNVLAGNQGEQVAAFTESWNREFQSAMSLVTVQENLLRLTHQSNQAPQIFAPGLHTHVIIALEETGDFQTDELSAVGGVFLCATGVDETSAKNSAVKIQEELRSKGVRFYERTPYYTDAEQLGTQRMRDECLEKKSAIGDKLSMVFKENADIKLAAFRYSIPASNYAENGAYREGAYLRGLSNTVELVCCDLLPSLGIEFKGNVTISFWFPTKQTCFLDETEEVKKAYHTTLREEKKKGNDLADAKKAAKAASRQAKEHLFPAAILAAKKASEIFDFRHQVSPNNPELETMVETVGGYGNAYSLFVLSLGRRKILNNIIPVIRSLKARKIPYQRDQFGKYTQVNNWFCNQCKQHLSVQQISSVPRSAIHGQPFCPTCKSNTHMYADYSVVSHLADSALDPKEFPNKEIGRESLVQKFCFDVVEGILLDDFIHVSRLLDNDRAADGFKLAYTAEPPFFRDGLNSKNGFATAPLEGRLVHKLKEYAPSAKGVTLTELAGIRTRGIGSTSVSVSVNQNHPNSKKDKQKTSGVNTLQTATASQQQSQVAGENWITFSGPVPWDANLKELAKDVFKKHDLIAIPNQKLTRTKTTKKLKVSFDLTDLEKISKEKIVAMNSLINENKISADEAVKGFLKSKCSLEVKLSPVAQGTPASVTIDIPSKEVVSQRSWRSDWRALTRNSKDKTSTPPSNLIGRIIERAKKKSVEFYFIELIENGVVNKFHCKRNWINEVDVKCEVAIRKNATGAKGIMPDGSNYYVAELSHVKLNDQWHEIIDPNADSKPANLVAMFTPVTDMET